MQWMPFVLSRTPLLKPLEYPFNLSDSEIQKKTTMSNPDENYSLSISAVDNLIQRPGFVVRKSGFVTVRKSVEAEEIPEIIATVQSYQKSTIELSKMLAIAIGSLILAYSAKKKISKTQAVDELDVVKTLDQAEKTVLKWARICEVLPEEILQLPHLHISHLDAAVSYSGPENPTKLRKFSESRDLMLREVSADPEGKGKSYVEERMRGFKDRFGAPRKVKESTLEIAKKYIQVVRLLKMNPGAVEPLLKKASVERKDLSEWARSYEDELIERGTIPAIALDLGIPWKS